MLFELTESVSFIKPEIQEQVMHGNKKGGRHIDRTFFAQIHVGIFLPLLSSTPFLLHLDLHPIKKPATIVFGVNFTSAFHTHARRSTLMDFHLSPVPTHPALIIRGMRTTNAQGMPGYAVEFMTSTETDTAGIPCRARQLAAISKKSAAIKRAWDNFNDYATIRRSSTWTRSAKQIAILPRNRKPHRIGLN